MALAIRRQLLAPEGSGGAFADNGGEVEPGEFAQAWPRGEECHGYDGCRGEGAGGGADVSVWKRMRSLLNAPRNPALASRPRMRPGRIPW